MEIIGAPPGMEPVAQFVSIWKDIPGRSKRSAFASYDISMIIGTWLIYVDHLSMIWLNRKQILLQRAPPGVEPVAQFVYMGKFSRSVKRVLLPKIL